MPSASSKSSQVAQTNEKVDLLQEPMKNAVSVADKKLRNLEKRKLKLLETKKKADQGHELNEDQKKALEMLISVDFSLETVKDVQKSLAGLELEHKKLLKKEEKRVKQEHKDQVESRSHQIVFNVVEVQAILGELSEEVRPDFLSGSNGACKLSESDFENLDAIYELINPAASEEKDKKLSERVKAAGEHLTNLVEGKNKPAVKNLTYKEINEILQKIKSCGYFDKDNSNGQSVETTSTTPPAEEAPEEEEEKPVEPVTTPATTPAEDESPEEEFPSTEFQEAPSTLEAAPVVPVNGVDLPPEVQETPEDESIDFLGESEISTATQEAPSLNPVSPEFIPRKLQPNQEEGAWDNGGGQDNNSGDNWQQVEGGQSHQQGSGNYRGRGGRGSRGGNYRGGRGGRGGSGGNYRGGQRDGSYRGNRGGDRGGSRGGSYRGGNREGGNYRGGQRDGGRGGGRGRGRGSFGQPAQQQ